MSKRALQINVTVPRNKEKVLKRYDAFCKQLKMSRSEGILALMDEANHNYEQFFGAPATETNNMPEWLR